MLSEVWMNLKERWLLLVEDDPEIRDPLADYLRVLAKRHNEIKLHVVAFADGESALAGFTDRAHYDLIVSDLNLGPTRMNGLEFLETVRTERSMATPAILNTASELGRAEHLQLDRLRVTHVRKPDVRRLYQEVIAHIN